MKNLFKFVCVLGLLISSFAFISCENSQQQDELINTGKKLESSSTSSKRYIYHATWTEWGRASKNCDGWGLCNYSDCWFCEGKGKYKGKVDFDDTTKEGFLIIELNPAESLQNDAITNQSKFYVDEDINNTNSILHSGEYPFDSSVGEYGGYKIGITVK